MIKLTLERMEGGTFQVVKKIMCKKFGGGREPRMFLTGIVRARVARAHHAKGKMECDGVGEWAASCHDHAGFCGPLLLRVCIFVVRAMEGKLGFNSYF